MVSETAAVIAIVPAHNEGPRIGPVVCALIAQGLTVMVVNDGSTDDTEDAARAAGARVLSLTPNRGKGAALKAGFREVLGDGLTANPAEPPASATPRWDAILTLDGDGQHDPAEAPALIAAWSGADADLVVGARDYESMPPVRWFTNSVSRVLFSRAVGEKIPDNQSGYRLRSRRLAEATLASPEQGFAFEVEEIAICVGRGYKLAWVPIKTIYGTEVSDIKPWSHFVSFIRVTRRARRRVRQERRMSCPGGH
jgi:glycosyltransferase involved in cell wall biosynthesis